MYNLLASWDKSATLASGQNLFSFTSSVCTWFSRKAIGGFCACTLSLGSYSTYPQAPINYYYFDT